MPTPGDDPRNPDHLRRFERFHRNRLLLGTRDQSREFRHTVAEPGTLRRLWRNLAGYTGGPPPFNWTANRFDCDAKVVREGVTTSLRYLISTVNTLTVGNQLSQPMLRPAIPPRVTHSPPSLVMAGNAGYRPTLRTRVPSFGSRVPALNAPSFAGAEEQ